ncbi:MAG: zincin-like metallopeptidase domain-containing protein [Gammaproteobacteria bacterium]|nr:zincin-like metallopeptidase domain-containing protein [Gammaproteobacteria bacterium]
MAEPETTPSTKPAIDSPSRYYGKFADMAIRQMEAGTAPWQRPWKPGEEVLPRNAITGRAYTGGNALYLAGRAQDRNFADNRWVTHAQIKEAGARPPKGPGERILFRDDRNGRQPVWRTAIVYNVEQVQRLDLPRRSERPYWQAHNSADAVIAASEVDIKHSPSGQAYYSKDHDQVVLPEPVQFRSPEHYYTTALRNMAHASGHESRMDRETFKQTHSEGLNGAAHGREKLRVEIATMMAGARLGVGYEPNHDPAYKELWIKALKEDPREIHRAAADGHRIARNLIRPARGELRDIVREARAAIESSTERNPHEIPNPRPTPQRQAPAMSPGR